MSPEALQKAALALAAYGAGCFVTGYYLVRLARNRDLRASGSGSAGARNAGRVLGRAGFVGTFAGDALKGAAVIWAAKGLQADPGFPAWLAPLVVAGHIWPVQLGFRGGKGLATALGAMLGLDPRFALAGLPLYFLPRLHPRGHALSGIAPMAVLPFLPFPAWNPSQAAALAFTSCLVLFAHRAHSRPARRRSLPARNDASESTVTPG